MLRKVIFLTAGLLCGCAFGSPQVAPGEYLSLCELRDAGDLYEGRTVVIRGVYHTDRMEISFVGDSVCRGVIISPYFSRSPEPPSVRAFNLAVTGDIGDLSARQFRVELRGVVGKLERDGVRRFDVSEVISYERLSALR